MDPKFRSTESGLEIIDPITRHRYQVRIPGGCEIERICQSTIQHDVDTAVRTTTSTVVLPQKESTYILDQNGSILSNVAAHESFSLPDKSYTFDISTPLKILIQIEGELGIHVENGQTRIDVSKPTPIVIGARSAQSAPIDRIKTPPNPTDVMEAVSMFGSALKETGPQRSYPTLRQHPPLLQIGNKLDIPDDLKRPKTGVQIEVPPTFDYIFTVTPLAYYLGAEVVPSSEPRLSTKNGFSFRLENENDFESTVSRLLKHIFYLDCIIRTEDSSPGPVHERQVIEPLLEFDIPTVYEQSLSKQLETYLEIPFSMLESHYPEWYPKTKVQPSSDHLQFLPFLANQLSSITTGRIDQPQPDPDFEDEAVEALSNILSVKQTWNYSTGSENTSAVPLSAFHNKICRSPKEGDLEIEIVCNELDMDDELIEVYGTYGNREELPFSVTIHHDLTTTELKSIFTSQNDFVHYIGHIDRDGFRCSDGKLDPSSINNVKAKSFLLNACQSYEQGRTLVEAGSLGGIVTLDDVQNDNAVTTGSIIARLLNFGYSFSATLDVLQTTASAGNRYRIVGDGTTSIAQSTTGVPSVCSVLDTSGENIRVNIYTYNPTRQKGSIRSPNFNSNNIHHLSNNIGPISIKKTELLEYLDRGPIPVLIDGEMYWSDDITLSDLE
ncbi:hypothetical protein [Natronococcus occultus]|uniref:CHAT domain-containing protein n=1 Tax=Natronococcus occultus SP4 TaxID=694430 RepID=L0JVD8_9EURY|nr:hypothetical protein [Natronococcus occultus]AGB36084.1 hypothetical protein Natoc_0207 [Natronococcus occultus SP4]